MRMLDLTEDERRDMMEYVLDYAHMTGDYSRFDDLMDHAWEELMDAWDEKLNA